MTDEDLYYLKQSLGRHAYNTMLTPARESQYQQWLIDQSMNTGRDVSRDIDTYDLRGFFKDGGNFSAGQHGTDKYKKPTHITFSDQSMYSTSERQGGRWEQTDTGWNFYPSEYNMQQISPELLQAYFDNYELPGTKLVMKR